MNNEILYHYTTLHHLGLIMKDGVLKASGDAKKYGGKKSVLSLWFSTNPVWEPKAAKKVLDPSSLTLRWLNMEEMHELTGLARIAIRRMPELITWAKYKHVSTLPPEKLEAMEERGLEAGSSPKEWSCILGNLHQSKWEFVEIYDGNNWIPYDEVTAADILAKLGPITIKKMHSI